MIFFWPRQIGLKYFWNISEIFLRYFWNISEIFLIIGDPYLLIFLDFCWFLVGMWLLSSFFFVSQPKSGKITVFPNFQFFSIFFKNCSKKIKHSLVFTGKGVFGPCPGWFPRFFFFDFFDFLRKTVIFRFFHIFSENQTILKNFFKKKQNFIGIYRERCVWALPRLVPQIFFFFNDFLKKTVIFPDFQIFPHIFRKSDNFQIFFKKNQKTQKRKHIFFKKKSGLFAIQKIKNK